MNTTTEMPTVYLKNAWKSTHPWIFQRLVEKVEEINRSTRSGESVLRLYDPEAEETFIAERGIMGGQTDILSKTDAARSNREASEMEEILRAAQETSALDADFLEHLASAMTGGAPATRPRLTGSRGSPSAPIWSSHRAAAIWPATPIVIREANPIRGAA